MSVKPPPSGGGDALSSTSLAQRMGAPAMISPMAGRAGSARERDGNESLTVPEPRKEEVEEDSRAHSAVVTSEEPKLERGSASSSPAARIIMSLVGSKVPSATCARVAVMLIHRLYAVTGDTFGSDNDVATSAVAALFFAYKLHGSVLDFEGLMRRFSPWLNPRLIDTRGAVLAFEMLFFQVTARWVPSSDSVTPTTLPESFLRRIAVKFREIAHATSVAETKALVAVAEHSAELQHKPLLSEASRHPQVVVTPRTVDSRDHKLRDRKEPIAQLALRVLERTYCNSRPLVLWVREVAIAAYALSVAVHRVSFSVQELNAVCTTLEGASLPVVLAMLHKDLPQRVLSRHPSIAAAVGEFAPVSLLPAEDDLTATFVPPVSSFCALYDSDMSFGLPHRNK